MLTLSPISRPTVYICVEIKNRELDSQLLLAANLSLMGFRCFLGSHASIFAVLNAKKAKAGILLDKGTLPSVRMNWIRTKCDSIVVMDQELGPPLENPIEHLVGWPSRIYPETETLIDKYLCVGPKVFQAARIRFSKQPEKVRLTGWPRVDIWRKLGDSIYKEEIAALREKHGRFLLFISDFGVSEDADIYIEGLKCISANDLNFQRTLEALRNWDKNPEIDKIIVRPHITEDVRLWKKLLRNLAKTEVNKELNVTPWVLASAGIIHRGSTVAIEAKLSGKDVFFLKETASNGQNEFANLMSDAVVSSDIEGSFPKIDKDEKQNQTGLNEYVLLEDVPATTRVTDELVGLVQSLESGPTRLKVLRSQIRPRNLMRLGGLIKHEVSWKLKLTAQPPYSHCFPGGITRKDIEKVLKSEEKYFAVKARVVTFNCWEISL